MSPAPAVAAPTPAGPARLSDPAAEAAITAACRLLHLPTVRAEAGRIAEAAARERLTHRAYLADVLAAECDDRESRRGPGGSTRPGSRGPSDSTSSI